ncbi:MAG: hypothetical protein HQ483_20130 [Rhodospirillales bacterium]|nr:hypothetical protein [Rhodospirillales bacterium]
MLYKQVMTRYFLKLNPVRALSAALIVAAVVVQLVMPYTQARAKASMASGGEPVIICTSAGLVAVRLGADGVILEAPAPAAPTACEFCQLCHLGGTPMAGLVGGQIFRFQLASAPAPLPICSAAHVSRQHFIGLRLTRAPPAPV